MNQVVLIELTENAEKSAHYKVGCVSHGKLDRRGPFDFDALRCSRKSPRGTSFISLGKYPSKNMFSRQIRHRQEQFYICAWGNDGL
jgi:hypothetical protein